MLETEAAITGSHEDSEGANSVSASPQSVDLALETGATPISSSPFQVEVGSPASKRPAESMSPGSSSSAGSKEPIQPARVKGTAKKPSDSRGQHLLSESSRMTAATARDISGTDHDSSNQGAKMRLSVPADPSSPRLASRQITALFRKKKDGRHSSSAADLESGSDPLHAVQSVVTQGRAPMMDSLSEEDSHGRQDEMIEQEERKDLIRQIVFCVVFTCVLFTGVGVSVVLHIGQNK